MGGDKRHETAARKRKTGNGRHETGLTGDRRRETEDGDGGWKMVVERRETDGRRRETGDRRQDIGDCRQDAGNERRDT